MSIAKSYKIVSPVNSWSIKSERPRYPYHSVTWQTWDQEENMEWPVEVTITAESQTGDTHFIISMEWRYVAEPLNSSLPDDLLAEAFADMAEETMRIANTRLTKDGVEIRSTRARIIKSAKQVLSRPPQRIKGE